MTVNARLFNTGIFNSNTYFDEITSTGKFQVTTIASLASSFNEVSSISVPLRVLSDGTLLSNNYFDEISTITNPVSIANTFAPWQVLDTVATYLRSYSNTSLRTPNFNLYNLDGPTLTTTYNISPYFILDGGGDMFDGGNYTASWLYANTDYTSGTSIPTNLCINYNDTTSSANILDTNFYYASLGYSNVARPLTVLGARSNTGSPVGFQKAGNSGADGTGSRANGAIYTGNTINGFTVHATYTQSYGTTDPVVCDVFILLGHSNWNSVFDKVRRIEVAGTVVQGGALIAFGPNTSNVMSITTLISKPAITQIPVLDIQNLVNTYTTLVGQSLNFF
jgi:hypothetical protein